MYTQRIKVMCAQCKSLHDPDEPCRDGDYATYRGADSPEARNAAEQHLIQQGCTKFRYDFLPGGGFSLHGYL